MRRYFWLGRFFFLEFFFWFSHRSSARASFPPVHFFCFHFVFQFMLPVLRLLLLGLMLFWTFMSLFYCLSFHVYIQSFFSYSVSFNLKVSLFKITLQVYWLLYTNWSRTDTCPNFSHMGLIVYSLAALCANFSHTAYIY